MNINQKDIIDCGNYLPEVIDVDYLGGYKLFLRFQDGKQGSIDFSDKVKEGVFSSLKDQKNFIKFGIMEKM